MKSLSRFHEIAANVHDSSSEVEDSETRQSVMKKSRVDADMEISAIEALTNAKLGADRALDKANKTLHRLLEEIPLESEAVTKIFTEVYEKEADAKIISGKWVLKPHTARYVLRGIEEDVKDEDVFARTTMTASVRLLLSQATDLTNEGYTVFTADVQNRLHQHTHEGRCRGVRKTAIRVAAGDTVSEQRNSDLETSEKSSWPEKRTETLTGPPRVDPQEVRLRPEHAGHTRRCEYHSCSTWTTCCWLERTRSSQEQRGDDKTNALLGKEGYNLGVDASFVERMLGYFLMSALKSSPTLRWECREKDEKEMPASEYRVYGHLVGKLLWIDRADLRCAMGQASSIL